MAAQVAGENASVEYRLCGADGVTRWMRERSKSQELPGGAIEVIGIATDISSSRAAAAALAASEAKLEHVLKAVDAYVYVLETRRGRRLARRSARASSARSSRAGSATTGDASRREWFDLIHPDDRDQDASARPRPSPTARSSRLPIASSATTAWSAGCSTATCRTTRGDGRNVRLGLVLDVSDRRQLERRLQSSVDQLRSANAELRQLRMQAEQQARTDVVTGAHNRLALSEHVALALEAGHEGGLVLLDLDHFKQINDALGHGAGDRVLVEVARRLREAASPHDCVARWGGEEFAVLLRDVGDERELARRGRRAAARHRHAPIVRRRRVPDRRGVGRGDAADAGREPRHARRAGRPRALRGQAAGPQPRAAGERDHRERPHRRAAGGDPHRRGARGRRRRARGRAAGAPRLRRLAGGPHRALRCTSTRAPRCAASSAAGCTTSASCPCPSACCSSR